MARPIGLRPLRVRYCPYCGTDVHAGMSCCPWCERSLAGLNLAPSPEEAARQMPGAARRVLRWLAVLAMLALGAAVIGPFLAGLGRTRPGSLKADLAYRNGELLITNLDAFEWREVRVTLNAGPDGARSKTPPLSGIGATPAQSGPTPSGYYTHHAGLITPGEVYAMPLASFTNAEGQRFAPDSQRILNIGIRCQTPSGEAVWFGGLFGVKIGAPNSTSQ